MQLCRSLSNHLLLAQPLGQLTRHHLIVELTPAKKIAGSVIDSH
jgi:hypothetical protein